MDLESKRPSGPLFRVGRDDDAWAVPDWAYAKEDGTFGNRFDDPMGVYRVRGSLLPLSLRPFHRELGYFRALPHRQPEIKTRERKGSGPG